MAKRGGIDYSKWDNFTDSDSENENESGIETEPRVTKLDDTSQITIHPKNQEQRWSVSSETQEETKAPLTIPNPERNKRSRPRYCLEDLGSNGGGQPWSGEGDGSFAYIWSQNRYEVVIHAAVPPNTRASHMQVLLTDNILHVAVEGYKDIISGALRYQIKREEEEEGSLPDWELVDLAEVEGGMRAVKIILKKQVPHEGLVIWWKNVIEGHSEVELSKIEGRNTTFADTWQQAQDMFRERVKEKKLNNNKIKIELDS